MATLNREQLVQYVRGLEERVRKYQAVLKAKNEEIAQLKAELAQWKDQAIAWLASQANEESEPVGSVSHSEQSKAIFALSIDNIDVIPNDVVSSSVEESSNINESLVSEPATVREETVAVPQENPPEEKREPEKIPLPPIHFKAGEFLSAVLEGEEEGDEVKYYIAKMEGAEPDERRLALLSLTKLYWRMVGKMAKRLVFEDLTREKRLFMRFGMLDESLIKEKMHIWQSLYQDTSTPEETGIYYLDEWLDAVAHDEFKYSMIDEMALDGAKPDPNATGALALKYEAISVYQMQRMCVGPQANLITILTQTYCNPGHENPMVTRPWLRDAMMQIVKCDCTLFQRKYKGEEFQVKPLFVITPGYGQKSGCWEPWSPGQKRTTGPRICISLFPPRNTYEALLMGLADYRWEYAKADAMHYWMTEGLTGKWYALFNRRDQRGDLKQDFMDDYYHWIINESRRTPKLDRKFREFFWHNVPFGDEIKEYLRGSNTFSNLITLEEEKKRREQEDRIAMEKLNAERATRKAARLANLGG